MKKSKKKLSLHRETIQVLTLGNLKDIDIAGGSEQTIPRSFCNSCTPICQTDFC